MNRTRFVFFGVLAVLLAILAVSLAQQLMSEARLLQIFVASAVFALGVVALDFLGVLGHHDGDFAGHEFSAHDLGGHVDSGHDFSAHDVVTDHGGDHDVGAHDGAGHDAGDGHDHATEHQVEAGRAAQPQAAPVLSVLAYLRMMVYFCLGFGPVGVAAILSRWGGLRSLALAAAAGAVSLYLARLFFRFQRRDTGAVPASTDLLREQATVLVPLDHDTMGKVRVQVGQSVSDVYALAADPGTEYRRGDSVRIVEVSDDCVKVR